MNTTNLYENWSLVLETGEVTGDQENVLLTATRQDPNLVSYLIDDLALHGMLKSLSDSDDQDAVFVTNCMKKIRQLERQQTENILEIETRQTLSLIHI